MSLTNIRFGTFNKGLGIADFEMMLAGNEPEKNKLLQRMQEKIGKQELTESNADPVKHAIYKETVIQTAERLARQLDVIALQEIGTLEKAQDFIQTLESHGFKIYHIHSETGKDNFFSTAIAIRQDLFENDIVNHSFRSQSHPDKRLYGQDIAAVVAKLKNMALNLSFASMHSWGFQLYHPDHPANQRSYNQTDEANAEYAKIYAQEAVGNSNLQVDYALIGGDMNNNNENHGEPFNIIRTAGYEILEPDQETNVNYVDAISNPPYTFRKIDFLFAKGKENFVFDLPANLSFVEKIKYTFNRIWSSTPLVYVTPAKVLKDFDFTADKNCSDHKPVGTNILIATSVASKIWLLTRQFFNELTGL